MINLRNFFSAIDINLSESSLLAVAQKFQLNSSFSVVELMQTASGSPDPTNQDFRVLPIATEGSGKYRADRFRIYFQHPTSLSLLSIPDLVSTLDRLFPQIFNGFGDEVSSAGLTPNIAKTFYHFDKRFNSEPTLKFTADIRTLFDFVDAPDLHDDWVGFVHQDQNVGFAVQTLKRNFSEVNDLFFALLVAEAIAFSLPGGGGGVFPIGGGITSSYLNRFHFLAGRRSWVISQANQSRGSRFVANNPIPDFLQAATATNLANSQHIYMLETAAIDRFSSWVIGLADLGAPVTLGNMEDLTARVWTTLLSNFVAFKGYTPGLSFAPAASLYPEFPNELSNIDNNLFIDGSGVTFIQETFNTLDDCLAQDWVQDLLELHPGIRAQW